MSVAISVNHPYLSPKITPFCDLRFKKLRMVAETVAMVVLAFFLVVPLSLLRMFTDKPYLKLVNYIYSVLDKINAYVIYKHRLIDFSKNSIPFERKQLGVNKPMSSFFDKKLLNEWLSLEKFGIKFDKEKSVTKEVEKGCCYGMSLDFAALYLKEIQKGKSTLDALKLIAPQFVHGASDRAILAQMAHQKMPGVSYFKSFLVDYRDTSSDVRWPFLDTISAERYVRTSLSVDDIDNEIKKTLEGEVKKLKNERTSEMADTSKFKDKCKKKLNKKLLRIENEGVESQLYKVMGLQADLSDEIEGIQDFSNIKQSEMINKKVSELREGIYRVTLKPLSEGHSIIYIKDGQNHFMYDPNDGTVQLNQEDGFLNQFNYSLKMNLKAVRFRKINLS